MASIAASIAVDYFEAIIQAIMLLAMYQDLPPNYLYQFIMFIANFAMIIYTNQDHIPSHCNKMLHIICTIHQFLHRS
jgi:hypothetical protein